MGFPMAGWLSRAGYSVSVFNRTEMRARKWLEQSNIEYIFHDIRGDQFNKGVLKKWLLKSKVEAINNKRSATWRGLSLKVQKEFLEEKKEKKVNKKWDKKIIQCDLDLE